MLVFYIFILQIVYSIIANSVDAEEGYYWRDYNKIIPADAVPGGLDENGLPIYIGQVLHQEKLIPGKIYSNNSAIYFQWGPELSTYQNIKILCSLHPERFKWILTKPDEFTLLNNHFLVKGGYEPNYFTFIGRVHLGYETTIGKVICRLLDCMALYATYRGNFTEYRGIYEILSYDVNYHNTTMNTTRELGNCSCQSLENVESQ